MTKTKEMNGAVLGSIIVTAAFMASSGLAFADSKGLEVRLNAGASSDHRVQVGDIKVDGRADVSAQGKAGVRMDDDNDGIAGKRQDAERRQDSKDKENRGEDHGTTTRGDSQGFGKGGIRAFWSFFFGLPASTTVGDIRAEMTATTSVDASKSQGLGFWGRLFGAFKFGGGNN